MTQVSPRRRLPGQPADHSVVVALLWALAAAVFTGGCAQPESAAAVADSVWFEEVAAERGIQFSHVRALQQRYHFPEIMSGGAAWIDYDRDGFLDLYLVQGGDPDGDRSQNPPNVLYRNRGGGVFEEVPYAGGAADRGYGM